MKNVILVLAVSMTTLTYANRTFDNAVDYNNFLVGEYNKVKNSYLDVIDEMNADYTNKTGIWDAHATFIKNSENAIDDVSNATVFGNGNYFKEQCVKLLQVYLDYGKGDMKKVIDLYTKEVFTEDDKLKLNDLQDKFFDAEEVEGLMFDFEQLLYADEHDFTVGDNDSDS